MAEKTTEEVVREVLSKSYAHDPKVSEDAALIAEIVALVEDENPSMRIVVNEDTASYAATAVRDLLWSRYNGGGASANAAGNLLVVLDRKEELGWLDEHLG